MNKQYIQIKASGSGSETIEGGHKVLFIDYRGKVLKVVYVSSGASATPPEPPTYLNLTFSRWQGNYQNVTQDEVVGAIYNVSDGKTRLFITLNATTGLSPTMYLNLGGMTTIDFGDGISGIYYSGLQQINHTYDLEGEYQITIDSEYSYDLGSNSSTAFILFAGNYRYCLTKMYISENCYLTDYGLYFQYNLAHVALYDAAETGRNLYSFRGGYSLECLVIPNCYVSSIGSNYAPFGGHYGLKYLVFPLEYRFPTGDAALQYASMSEFRLPNPPAGVTTFGNNLLYSSSGLQKLTIPEGYTTLPANTCYQCQALVEVNLPQSLTTITGYAFPTCRSLRILVVPAGVTTFAATCFATCTNFVALIMLPVIPPTASSSNPPVPSTPANLNLKIYVPDESVDAYKAAVGWSVHAARILPLSTLD